MTPDMLQHCKDIRDKSIRMILPRDIDKLRKQIGRLEAALALCIQELEKGPCDRCEGTGWIKTKDDVIGRKCPDCSEPVAQTNLHICPKCAVNWISGTEECDHGAAKAEHRIDEKHHD